MESLFLPKNYRVVKNQLGQYWVQKRIIFWFDWNYNWWQDSHPKFHTYSAAFDAAATEISRRFWEKHNNKRRRTINVVYK